MVRFSFRKRTTEEEGIPEEEATQINVPESEEVVEEGPSRSRRLVIIAGIGAILIGGGYLATQLFLAPPPTPPAPARPGVPRPSAKAPAPATPTKEAAPAPAVPAKPPTKGAAQAPATPAKPPTKVETKAAPPAKVAAAPPAPAAKAAPEKARPPEKAPATPRVEARVQEKPAPAPPSGFSLQVGAMVMEENAENLKRKLEDSGYPSTIRKGTAFVTKHVVSVMEPTGKREAEELSRRLNVDGFPSQLLPVGGKYTPQIGAFFNLDEAIDLARELQKKNYQPKITSKPANTVVFQVRHGKFESRAAAVRKGEELRAKGFNFLVVQN